MTLDVAAKACEVLYAEAQHSFFGFNVSNNIITSTKIYFTLENEVFSDILYRIFNKKIDYKLYYKDEHDIGTRLPGVAIKITKNNCDFAYYYNTENINQNILYEKYILKAYEGENERTYLYSKHNKIISKIKKTYRIDIDLNGVEICQGMGEREGKKVYYEKIAVIADYAKLKKYSPLKIDNISIISYGEDSNHKTRSFYYADLDSWRLTPQTINQLFSKTIIDGKAIYA